MSVSRLPTELWFLILEHATILRPSFLVELDADLVEDPNTIRAWLRDPSNKFRKQWAVLRQVCRSWRAFVDRADIKLRFVRTHDLSLFDIDNTPDIMAETGIMQARRIQGGSVWPQGDETMADIEENLVDRISSSLPQGAIFNAVTIVRASRKLGKFIIKSHAAAFPHLRCLSLDLCRLRHDRIFPELSNNFPSMTVLLISSLWNFRLRPEVPLQMSSLKTLKIWTPRYIIGGASFDQWSLPCLRYLDIGKFFDIEDSAQLFGTLPRLGPKLEFLSINIRGSDDEGEYIGRKLDMLSQLWDSCPNLRRLHIPLYLIIMHKPPLRHPLRYLINSGLGPNYLYLLAMSAGFVGDIKDTLISFCEAVPDLLVLRDNHSWTEIGLNYLVAQTVGSEGVLSERDREASRLMVETAVQMKTLDMKVRFEDKKGEIWEGEESASPV